MEEVKNKNNKTIAFDFDGVIARYDGFKGAHHIEEPILETVNAIKILREKGFKILIHSTRGDQYLIDYCKQFDIPYDYINRREDKHGENMGKPVAYVYVDDRAICFNNQKADELVEQIESFKAYWE